MLVLETTWTFTLKRGVGNGMMNGKDLDCCDRARRKSLCLVDARVGWVECAEMQHSPSSAANPQVLRVNRDLVFGEHFCEDVRGHILRGAIDNVDCPVHDCYDSFFLALLYADTSDCLLSPLPHPLIGLLYFYDLIWLTRSHPVASCLVRYSSGVVIRSLLYDTYLRATHTTTSSIGGVQIPICVVSNATDSLQRSVAVLKLYQ